jgi:hypothetical protein
MRVSRFPAEPDARLLTIHPDDPMAMRAARPTPPRSSAFLHFNACAEMMQASRRRLAGFYMIFFSFNF